MSKRRLMLPLALAALLMVMPLAGCGKSPAPTTPPATAPAATTAAPATPEPTPVPTPVPTATPRPIVTVRGMLPGEAPADMDVVLTELNGRLVNELSSKLELQWSASDKYDEAVAAAVASDAKPDFIWCSSSGLGQYAEKKLIAPLDELLAGYGADIAKNIDAVMFETMKIDGNLMGIPSSGNMPLKSGGQALIYRDDLRESHALPKPDSIANLELYFTAIAQKEPGMIPLSHKSAALIALWMAGSADIMGGTNNVVAYSAGGDGKITCAALQSTDAFKQAVQKARAWYKAGWLHKSILISKDPSADVSSGAAAATVGNIASVPAMQDALAAKQAGATLCVLPLTGIDLGFIDGNGGNAICIAASSQAQDRAMELLNWIYATQENHDLIYYGVKDRNYSLLGERVAPEGDGYQGALPSIFANLNYMRFPSGASDEYIETVKSWNDGAALSPIYGFAFDPAAVKDELAKAKTVYANYGPQMLSGSGDAEALLAEYGAKMAAAGQDKIVTEAQNQVDAFIAAK